MIPRVVMWDWRCKDGNRWIKEEPPCPCLVELVQETSSFCGENYCVISHPYWSGNNVEQNGVDKKYIGHYWNVPKSTITEIKKLKPCKFKKVVVFSDHKETIFP